jgi:hypothetical protein
VEISRFKPARSTLEERAKGHVIDLMEALKKEFDEKRRRGSAKEAVPNGYKKRRAAQCYKPKKK